MDHLLLSLLLCSLMLSGIFFLAWQNFGRRQHALTWALAFGAGAAQYSINLLSDALFSNRGVYWIVANAAGIVVVSLALMGFRQWAVLPVRVTGLALTGIAAVGVVAGFTFATPHVGLQMFFGPAYGGVACLLCAHIIFQQRQRTTSVPFAAAGVFCLFGLSQILAAFAGLMQGAAVDQGWLDVYRQINFLALPAGYLGMGLFTVLILASDLSGEMEDLARTDELTGALNRRGFDDAVGPLIPRARRGKQPLSVILVDVDHFKRINDQYGHSAGDHALRTLTRVLGEGLRVGDVLGRLGGEEFALALPGTDLEQAERAARRLREKLGDTEIGWRPEPFQISGSFGVTSLVLDDHTMDDLLQRADRAMYRAKSEGRDRVCAEPGRPPVDFTDEDLVPV